MSTRVRYGPVQLVLDVPEGELLLAWAAAAHKRQPATVLFRVSAGGSVLETLALKAAYCVAYHESFADGDARTGAYHCQLTLSDPDGWTLTAGGPATAFVAPAAREHGLPGAVTGAMQIGGQVVAASQVAAPFIVGADGIPRLPLITGDPPFRVNGPSKGKPGLDRVEFARQLSGQQDGLNRLTVAEFITNRDQYLAKAALTGDGRAVAGDAAQKLAREKAFKDKIDELQLEDESLSVEEANTQAEKWLKTQTALHDPDQVAGGHAAHITGMGDARVNSSIGAQWVQRKRITEIDRKIRAHATAMTPEQQATIFLDVRLPLV